MHALFILCCIDMYMYLQKSAICEGPSILTSVDGGCLCRIHNYKFAAQKKRCKLRLTCTCICVLPSLSLIVLAVLPDLQRIVAPVDSSVVVAALLAGHAPLPRTARARTGPKEQTVSNKEVYTGPSKWL